jgi:hypothetical protein
MRRMQYWLQDLDGGALISFGIMALVLWVVASLPS